MNKKVRFISFEGVDGSGKTTIINMLKENIKNIKNYTENQIVFTREPGGTSVGEKIRNILANDEMDDKTEALLFAASRAEHVSKKIIPALNENKIVICDRFIHSSLAFQGLYKNLGLEKVLSINEFGLNKCYPDVVFYIDVPIEVSHKRLSNRIDKIDRLDLITIDQIKKINESYKKALNTLKNVKIIKIDGTKTPREITIKILDEINKLLV